jgi:hypothetical protein
MSALRKKWGAHDQRVERMTSLDTIFFDRLEKARPVQALKGALTANEEKVLDLNRQQLDKGLDSEGRSLGKYKNFKYKGRFEPVDLKLTGAFRGAFTLKIDDQQTEIFSKDAKELKLVKRYGKDIFGVASPLIPQVQGVILVDFIANYQKQII